jgi:hypothetical protein
MGELNLSFEDKLADLVTKLKAIPVANYYTPTRSVYFCDVLVPENYEWLPITIDYYWDGDFHVVDEIEANHIHHGHTMEEGCCRAWFLCHVDGYVPTGQESPKWLKAFKKKWSYQK